VSLTGVSVVFLALVTLIITISIISRLFAPRKRTSDELATTPESASSAEQPSSVAASPLETKGPIEAIAVAAYAYHRRRRSRIRTAPSHGAWETAGRIRQLARSENRN